MDSFKKRIITKTLELFDIIGVKAVTTDVISKELKTSKKTLYEHFSSKEELIKQTLNESLSDSITELEDKIKNYSNTIHQQFLILENIQNLFFIKKNKISLQLERFYPEIYLETLQIQKQFIKTLLKNNITLGIEEGLYRAKINKKLTAEYFYLVTERIIMDENNPDMNPAQDNTKNYFLELLIYSIITKKGAKELEKITKPNKSGRRN